MSPYGRAWQGGVEMRATLWIERIRGGYRTATGDERTISTNDGRRARDGQVMRTIRRGAVPVLMSRWARRHDDAHTRESALDIAERTVLRPRRTCWSPDPKVFFGYFSVCADGRDMVEYHISGPRWGQVAKPALAGRKRRCRQLGARKGVSAG